MPGLNFHKRFADNVESGRKRQTIRAFRVIPIKPGDMLYLYTGLRTKYARKLGQYPAKSVELIHMHFNTKNDDVVILKETVYSTQTELDQFAQADGFDDWQDLKAWWKKTHNKKVFKGTLTKW